MCPIMDYLLYHNNNVHSGQMVVFTVCNTGGAFDLLAIGIIQMHFLCLLQAV